MSTQQVAIIVPALTAILLSLINVLWQTRITQKSLDHQRQVARDDRVQDRIATTYEELLELVGWFMEIVDHTMPVFGSDAAPDPPGPERGRRAQAMIGAHGSPEVKEILGRWFGRQREFFNEVETMRDMKNLGPGTTAKAEFGIAPSEQWKLIEAARKDLHALVRELEDRVNDELRA